MVMAEVAFSLVKQGAGTREAPKPTKLEVPPAPGCRDDEESCRRSLQLVANFQDLAKTVFDRYPNLLTACNFKVHPHHQGYLLLPPLKT